MSFLAAAALAVGVLSLAPLIAHLLQRGRTREQEFPAAALVPVTQSTSRERRRLEDRALLSVRVAMILGLAVLGATPLVRCDRLALARDAGGSVAFAIVLDDSMSMRATLGDGRTRWETALEGARALLAAAREGDAVAVVLAGQPARLALAATTDLRAAADALDVLQPEDRSTDLPKAVQLGRSAVRALPQADKRVVVLSDLADAPIAPGAPPVWTPIEALTESRPDCGILRAVSETKRARITIACQPAAAAEGRYVTLLSGTDQTTEVGRSPLPVAAGERTVLVEHESDASSLTAVLTGEDSISADDRAPVVAAARGLSVGVVADRALAAVATGGPTVLEQALGALDPAPRLQPLPVVPRDAAELGEIAALIVDDPPGLSPEARRALSEWVQRGGVAVAFLGPRAASAQLASTLEPFARGGAYWEASQKLGLKGASMPWLGQEATSLGELTRRGRARLDTAAIAGASVVGEWEDGAPFALERVVGRGLLLTLGLPVSVEESDLALRPGFIAMLDFVVAEAARRSSSPTSTVGTPWIFGDDERVRVEGPSGPVEVERVVDTATRIAVPVQVGSYRVVRDGHTQLRVVLPHASEILEVPASAPKGSNVSTGEGDQGRVDVSREVALLLLFLLLAEVLVRALRRDRPWRPAAAQPVSRG